jgi:hypothetical protein
MVGLILSYSIRRVFAAQMLPHIVEQVLVLLFFALNVISQIRHSLMIIFAP